MVQTSIFAGKKQRHRRGEWMCGHGNEGMTWENGNDIHTLPCVKRIARGKLMYSAGSSSRGSVVTWRGVTNGKEVRDIGIHPLIHFVVQQRLAQHGKATISQFLFKNYRNKKRKTDHHLSWDVIKSWKKKKPVHSSRYFIYPKFSVQNWIHPCILPKQNLSSVPLLVPLHGWQHHPSGDAN